MTKEPDDLEHFDDDSMVEDIDDTNQNDFADEGFEALKPKKGKKSAPKSPLKSKDKSPSGNVLFAIIVFIVVAAGIGYFSLEELLPSYHLESLVKNEAKQLKESVKFFNGAKEKKWFKERIKSLLVHPREASQRFGCRALTVFALNKDENTRIDAVTQLEKLLMSKSARASVQAEIVKDLGDLALQDPNCGALSVLATAFKTERKDGVGLDRNHRHFALKSLNQVADKKVEVIYLEAIKELDDPIGQDLKITLFKMLSKRFIQSTSQAKSPHDTSSAQWEHHVEIRDALVDAYINNEDQRIRRICWEACEQLNNARGLELWVKLLDHDDLMHKILAVTLLRRFSGQTFGFDPYDDSSDASGWQNYVKSFNP